MAGKKPAKPMAGKNTQPKLDTALYGAEVKYYGTKGSPAKCPSCGNETIRGMVRMKNNQFYCSIKCVSTTIEKVKDETI